MIFKNSFLKKVAFVLFIGYGMSVSAQKAAVKTNLFYDATTTMNLGVEFGLSPKWTMDVSGNYNPWTFSENKKWKHWLVQPEARYWFCNKFMGHFVGFHALGGQFNMGHWNTDFKFLNSDLSQLKEHRVQGWMIGAGVAYGYAWALSQHFNLEAEIGFGYAYMTYDKFACPKCGEKLENNKRHNYVGPTKAALNLVYVF